MLLSSLLLNSEAWVNLTEKDIRSLEQTDEILLSKVLECESNTSNIANYLELGVQPVRFKIMKRKIIFLQYILKQEKKSMISQVFEATARLSFSPRTHEHCLQEMLEVTGNLDGNLSKVSLIDKTIIFFN